MPARDSSGRFVKGGGGGSGGLGPSSGKAFVSMRLEGIDKVRGRIANLQAKAPVLAAQAMGTSAKHAIIPHVQAQLRKNRSILTGELSARMTYRSGIDKSTPFVEIGAFGVQYGLNVEKGAPPHTANTNRVREYVKKKMKFKGAMATAVTAQILSTLETSGSKAHPYLMPVWRARSGRFFAHFVKVMKVNLAKGK